MDSAFEWPTLETWNFLVAWISYSKMDENAFRFNIVD